MTRKNISLERLREALDYDPESGIFRWRIDRYRKAKAGDIAGSLVEGYIAICVDYVIYRASRLAWFHIHGTWPANSIDHIDGDKTNNRIANLRDVTVAQNNQNFRTARSDNRLGLLGVRTKNGRRFDATIWVDGKTKHIGTFSTPESAHAAYIVEKRKVHPFGTL